MSAFAGELASAVINIDRPQGCPDADEIAEAVLACPLMVEVRKHLYHYLSTVKTEVSPALASWVWEAEELHCNDYSGRNEEDESADG